MREGWKGGRVAILVSETQLEHLEAMAPFRSELVCIIG